MYAKLNKHRCLENKNQEIINLPKFILFAICMPRLIWRILSKFYSRDRMSFKCVRQQMVTSHTFHTDFVLFFLPTVRRNLQWSNLVIEEPSHGEPVQGLIASPADAAIVHISGHCHTQPLLAAPEENAITLTWNYIANARRLLRTFSL